MKCPIFAPHKEAAIAQLVERFTRNEEVPSSSLGCGSGQRGTAAGEFPLQPFRFPAEPRLHETGLPVIGDEQPGLPHIIGALHGIKYRQAIIQVGTVLRNGKREDAAVPVETPRIIEIEIRWVLSIPFFISCIRQQNPLTVLSKIILRKVKQFNLPPPKKNEGFLHF